MAKTSSVERNKKRQDMATRKRDKRDELRAIVHNRDLPLDERMEATRKMAELPRNSAFVRVRNRCVFSGRSRAYYRKFKLSRIALREFGSQGLIPGLVKSSW
ncbi:MAG: 30S ribosomal protein S14 [Thalassospira sp.]|jgi:small subunit ribosomal protein S14|nr:30S ribosomal protein S14 [Thalassospira sp.]